MRWKQMVLNHLRQLTCALIQMSLLQKVLQKPHESSFSKLKSYVGSLNPYDLPFLQKSPLTFQGDDIKHWNQPRLHHKSQPKFQMPNLSETMVNCLNRVPKEFFSQKYQKEFSNLGTNLMAIFQKQSDLSEYLDEVQICLFYQLNGKFDKLVQASSTATDLTQDLNKLFERVQLIRMKIANCENSIKTASQILKSQQRRASIGSVLKRMKRIKLLHRLPPTLKTLVQNGSNQKALTLLKSIQQSKGEFRGLSCLQNVELRIEQSQLALGLQINRKLGLNVLEYLAQTLSYQKAGLVFKNSVFQEESNSFIMDSCWVEEVSALQAVSPRSIARQESIFRILVQSQVILDCRQLQLWEIVKRKAVQARQRFVQDLEDSLLDNEENLLSAQKKAADFSLLKSQVHLKIITIFSQLARRLVFRSFDLLTTLIISLQKLEKRNQKIQNFIGIFAGLCRNILSWANQSLMRLIKLKPISLQMDILDVKNLMNVFQDWQRYDDSNLFKQLTSKQAQKIIQGINFKIFKQSRLQIQNSFAEMVSDHALMQQLKQSLETEAWTPTYVQTEYAQVIGYVINGDTWMKSQQIKNSVYVHSQISVLGSRRGRRVIGQQQQVRKERPFKIVRDIVQLQGRKYKIGVSVITMLQIIQDNIKMRIMFPQLFQKLQDNLLQILRYYNDYSKQLVLNATAKNFPVFKDKPITTKNLALLSRSLQFIVDILPSVMLKHKAEQQNLIRGLINKHVQDIQEKIESIGCSKIKQESNNLSQKINQDKAPCKVTSNILSSVKLISEVMQQYFPPEKYKLIMLKFIAQINTRYLGTLQQLLRNEILRKRVQEQLKYFAQESGWLGVSQLKERAYSLIEQTQ